MLTTQHGWWPFPEVSMGSPVFFRHTRLSLVEEAIDGKDKHVVTVAVVTTSYNHTDYATRVSVVAQGLSDFVKGLDMHCSQDERDVVDLGELVDFDTSEFDRGEDQSEASWSDDRHDRICCAVSDAISDGTVRRKPLPAAPDQSAYAW